MIFLKKGLSATKCLKSLNVRGNSIRDEGLIYLAEAIRKNFSLEELDISLNEITPIGISCIILK